MAPTQVLERRDQAAPLGPRFQAEPRPVAGMLGEERAQRAGFLPGYSPHAPERPRIAPGHDRFERLKRQHFTPEGRSERVARSLAALRSLETIQLDADTWKWVAEDIDLADVGLL